MPSRKCFPPRRYAVLNDLANKYKILPYQQERIKIDGMYKLPENKKIVDEYKDILITVSEKGEVNPSELAKLSRLRTLSLRLNIPHTLFDTLDELLLKDMQIVEVEEPDYVRDTRAIFEGLFFRTDKIRGHLSQEDLIKLLIAKQKSTSVRDQAFEGLLLDTVRACDEHARDTNDMSVLESMSSILTYFDRYDSAASMINNLAFMENSTLSEDNIRSLSGNKEVFDQISPDLFRELFIDPLRENRYLTRYGRKKVEMLFQGLLQHQDRRHHLPGMFDIHHHDQRRRQALHGHPPLHQGPFQEHLRGAEFPGGPGDIHPGPEPRDPVTGDRPGPGPAQYLRGDHSRYPEGVVLPQQPPAAHHRVP